MVSGERGTGEMALIRGCWWGNFRPRGIRSSDKVKDNLLVERLSYDTGMIGYAVIQVSYK